MYHINLPHIRKIQKFFSFRLYHMSCNKAADPSFINLFSWYFLWMPTIIDKIATSKECDDSSDNLSLNSKFRDITAFSDKFKLLVISCKIVKTFSSFTYVFFLISLNISFNSLIDLTFMGVGRVS